LIREFSGAMSQMGQKATSAGDRTTSDLPPGTDIGDGEGDVREVPILLQKSQKAQRLIFRQRTKQATIADQ
jgi:hypothetical protein